MIVIQGKSEKSKHVENLIRKEFRTDKVLIIDAVGYNNWSEGDWATIWMFDNEGKDVITAFEDITEVCENFDWIVFYVNTDEDLIPEFKKLDRKYSQNFILTVQSNQGLTSKYYI